jgi:surface polysaccharide O-acyltransferase-like enzyme
MTYAAATQPVPADAADAAAAAPGGAAVAPKREAAERIDGFDLLRVVSLLCIVWFHAGGPGSQYTVWRLPALLIISIGLLAGRPAPVSVVTLARRRGGRLLQPFAFWSLVYGLWLAVDSLRHGGTWHAPFRWNMLIAGTADHLWYLPFAFLVALPVNAVVRRLDAPAPAIAAGATLVAGVLLIAGSLAWRPISHPVSGWASPTGQWVYSLPAVALGVAVGAAARARTPGQVRLCLLTATLGTAAFCALLYRFAPTRHFVQPYLWAVPIVCFARVAVRRLPASVMGLTSLGLGIYLVHILVSHFVMGLKLFHRGSLAHATSVVLLSALLVWVLARTPLKRFI